MDAITRRALTEADVAGLVELENAVREADGDAAHRTGGDGVRGKLNEPLGTPDLGDYSGFFDGDRLVASGQLVRRGTADPMHYMRSEAFIHPEYRGRGLGTLVLRWMVELAPRVHERYFPGAPLELGAWVPAVRTAARELFEAEGFEPVRYMFGMRRPKDAPVVRATAPGGLEFVRFTPELSEPIFDLHLLAFQDHWRGTRQTPETWAARMRGASFRPELTFVLRDPAADRLAGYLVASENASATEATGTRDAHFDLIGTHRDYRRRGVASALIARAVEESRAQGYATASLGVDAANPTGAFSVYERAGFRPARKNVVYGRVLIESVPSGHVRLGDDAA